MTRPLSVIGHRGAAGHRLGNTMASYAYAIETGCDKIELDVRLSRDGVLFCHHDPALHPDYTILPDRSNASEWRIACLHSSFLQRCELAPPPASSHYQATRHPSGAEKTQRLPKLADVFRLVKKANHHVDVLVEIKVPFDTPTDSPLIQTLAGSVVEVAETEACLDRMIVCGAHWGTLAAVRSLKPGVRTWHSSGDIEYDFSLLAQGRLRGDKARTFPALKKRYDAGDAPWLAGHDPRAYGDSPAAAIAAAGGDCVYSRHNFVDTAVVNAAHQHGLDVGIWTVNRDSDIRRMVELGVDAICSDYPDRVIRIVQSAR